MPFTPAQRLIAAKRVSRDITDALLAALVLVPVIATESAGIVVIK